MLLPKLVPKTAIVKINMLTEMEAINQREF